MYLPIYLRICSSIYHSYRGLSDFLQLVRSRQEQSSAYRVAGSPLNTSIKLMSLSGEGILPRPSLSFNLNYLQEDIVSIYLAGRPIIEDVSNLRSVFKFRQEKTASINTQPSEYVTMCLIILYLISLSQSVHLSIYLFIIHMYFIYDEYNLFIHYSFIIYIVLSIYLSIHLSIHPFIYLSFYLSIYLFIYHLSIYLSTYLSIYLSLSLPLVQWVLPLI